MPKSSLALSNIRGFLILLVIAFHSFLAYLGSTPASPAQFNSPPYAWVAYPIVDSARWFGFDLFCAFLYVFMMQFMFFLSGLFVWPSLQSKGAKIFVQSRSVRLGVPFVLGICLLMPAAHYPVYLVTALDPSWSAFWQPVEYMVSRRIYWIRVVDHSNCAKPSQRRCNCTSIKDFC
jgi:hypothetical protein